VLPHGQKGACSPFFIPASHRQNTSVKSQEERIGKMILSDQTEHWFPDKILLPHGHSMYLPRLTVGQSLYLNELL
jgi:hypothetical protein